MIYKLLLAHFVGDLVLQPIALEELKKQYFYFFLAHCLLYTLPFYVIGMQTPVLIYLFVTHLIIDSMKLGEVLTTMQDQFLHLIALVTILLWV